MDVPTKFAAAALASWSLLRLPVISPSLLWRLLWLSGASFGILWPLAPLGGRFSISKQAIEDVQMRENVHYLEVGWPLQNKRSRTFRCVKMYTSYNSVRHYKTGDSGRADVRTGAFP